MGVLIGLTATILVTALGFATRPTHLELQLRDLRHRHCSSTTVHDAIVHIDIDDTSLEKLGRWPWPRRYLAQLIEVCRQTGARAIVLDIILPEEQRIEIHKIGVTDQSHHEPRAELVGQARPITIDNDAILEQAIDQAETVILPIHGVLSRTDAPSHPSDPTNPLSEPLSPRPSEPSPKSTTESTAHQQPPSQPPSSAAPPANQPAPDQSLAQSVDSLLAQHPGISFTDTFHQLWPQRDIHIRDADYQKLLETYIQRRAMYELRDFAFPAQPVYMARPHYQLKQTSFPIPRFARVLDNTGYVSFRPDKDGSVRRIPMLAELDGRLYKQLAFATWCHLRQIPDHRIDLTHSNRIRILPDGPVIPLDDEGMMLISWSKNYLSAPGQHIAAVFVGQIWENQRDLANNRQQLQHIENLDFQLSSVPDDLSQLPPEVTEQVNALRQERAMLADPEELKQANTILEKKITADRAKLRSLIEGKVVLVGSTSTGAADFVVTPISPRTPGVAVHGSILNTLLNGNFIKQPPAAIEITIALALGTLMTIITATLSPRFTALLMILLTMATTAANAWLAFRWAGYLFELVTPIAVILATFITVTFYRQIFEGRSRRLITNRFKQYAAPSLVDQIVKSPETIQFAGEERPITCFFSDLAGFTTVSEGMTPTQTVGILNIYLDRMTEILDRYYATINKFQGDGIFAFFGAPIPLKDHARLAALASLDCQSQLDQLVIEQQKKNPAFPSLGMRIGLNTGLATVGDCGSHRRFDYTAIGDNVNLAARLESANKAFGTRIMITEATRQQAGDDLATRSLGRVRVVGKTIGIPIYELAGKKAELSPEQLAYNERFDHGIERFQQSHFQQAAETFRQCLTERPDDKAASLYRGLSQSYQQSPPPEFDGGIELTSK